MKKIKYIIDFHRNAEKQRFYAAMFKEFPLKCS